MNIASGVLVAPRPIATVRKTVETMKANGLSPWLFFEPGCVDENLGPSVNRPHTVSPSDLVPSPEGVFGNFQNWLQAARDLLELAPAASAYLIAEDDAVFAPGTIDLLRRDMWPDHRCGVISLYCPNHRQYIRSRPGLIRTTRPDLIGALAMVFPATVLRELAYHPSIKTWDGAHGQVNPNPWELKAVDTWIGRALRLMRRTPWHYNPSLIWHNNPDPKVSNSSLGNGMPGIKRQARAWVGEEPKDLAKIFMAAARRVAAE